MTTKPQTGDVLLFAIMKKASPISDAIQQITGSWYSHAIVVLEEGRYAHSVPGKSGAVAFIEGDAALEELVKSGTFVDLYRPLQPPDPAMLLAAVEDFDLRAREDSQDHDWPCGKINRHPSVFYSDGNLLALTIARVAQKDPELKNTNRGRRLFNAAVVAAEDGDDRRIFCSSFVHRVLDKAGTYLQPPNPDLSFLNRSAFVTDSTAYRGLGPSFLTDWLNRWLEKALGLVDLDPQSLKTVSQVLGSINCHYNNRTPLPEPLHWANFVTPADLGESESLRRIARRSRLPNGRLEPWK